MAVHTTNSPIRPRCSLSNDGLQTLRQGEAVREHPVTGDNVWCNHAHVFHPNDLKETTRRVLEKRSSPLENAEELFLW